ncbi:hypothetical protein TNIN_132721 [Trichonephila inaurata madagascariensis]|uniref:C2H2-type domain-containing protein n=1 Tax=Trichonephila inaurata madagascariensis TaxID=2747483 RepID=A0A8X7CND3_9ARAC|nr:hypothetical protein TNIN_132721 [Trichonephila inaurata madagascariensis]
MKVRNVRNFGIDSFAYLKAVILYWQSGNLLALQVMSMEEMILSLPSESPSCVLCHQKFFNRSSLRRHMERHLLTNRRRFQCDICFKLFCRKDYVREHKQHMHGMRVESRVVDSECKNTE